jgi:hypothetical protein
MLPHLQENDLSLGENHMIIRCLLVTIYLWSPFPFHFDPKALTEV